MGVSPEEDSFDETNVATTDSPGLTFYDGITRTGTDSPISHSQVGIHWFKGPTGLWLSIRRT